MKNKMKKRFLWRVIQLSTKMYTMLVVTFTFIMLIEECMISPIQLLKLLGMSIAIEVVTAFRMEVEERQWMLRLPVMLKRMLFIPVYYAITVITILNLGQPFDPAKENIWSITGGFAFGLVATLLFKYWKEKKKETDLNLALATFQEDLK